LKAKSGVLFFCKLLLGSVAPVFFTVVLP